MDHVILKSTQRGYFSQFFWALLWLAALLILATSAADFKKTIGKFDADIIMYSSYALMLIIFISNLYTFFYQSLEVNTFFKNEKGFLNKLVCESRAFPYSRNTDERTFDIVTQIQISQGSIDRILDTGSITLRMITYTNADSQEYEITISAIENPYERKLDLERSLSVQEGLKVKIS